MKIHRNFAQKTDGQPTLEWILARTGVITASEADSLVTPLGKIRTGDGVETYLIKKLAERWTGGPAPTTFSNFNTEQGNVLEEEALPFAEFQYGLKIEQVGFVSLNSDIGCSPDGIIVDGDSINSGIEIKCPTTETHMRYLLDGVVPKDYVAQIQFSMFVTGAKDWHFLSYRRNFPALHIVVPRDDKFQTAIKEATDSFLARLKLAMERMIELNGGEPAAKNRGAVAFKLPETKTEKLDNIP